MSRNPSHRQAADPAPSRSGAADAIDFPDMRVAEPEKVLCDLAWLCESRGWALPVEPLRIDQLDLANPHAYGRAMGVDIARLLAGVNVALNW